MINAVLLFALVISFITDFKKRKIFNVITVPSIVFGLIYHFVNGGVDGLLYSFLGFSLGLGLLIIPFILGGMGAGDVKLLAAIGALKGSYFVFATSIYMGLIGGFIAVFILLKKRELLYFVRKVSYLGVDKNDFVIEEELNESNAFPYGVAIVFGAFCALLWGGF